MAFTWTDDPLVANQTHIRKVHIDELRNAINSLDSHYIRLDGTNSPTADINWGGFKITNLADPTNSQDAATKNYVDSKIGSAYHYAPNELMCSVYAAFVDNFGDDDILFNLPMDHM